MPLLPLLGCSYTPLAQAPLLPPTTPLPTSPPLLLSVLLPPLPPWLALGWVVVVVVVMV